MKNTSQSEQQEQEVAMAVYQICKRFMADHRVRDVHQHLAYMFAYFAATPMYAELREETRGDISFCYVDLNGLIDEIAQHIPDEDALKLIKLGQSQAAA